MMNLGNDDEHESQHKDVVSDQGDETYRYDIDRRMSIEIRAVGVPDERRSIRKSEKNDAIRQMFFF